MKIIGAQGRLPKRFSVLPAIVKLGADKVVGAVRSESGQPRGERFSLMDFKELLEVGQAVEIKPAFQFREDATLCLIGPRLLVGWRQQPVEATLEERVIGEVEALAVYVRSAPFVAIRERWAEKLFVYAVVALRRGDPPATVLPYAEDALAVLYTPRHLGLVVHLLRLVGRETGAEGKLKSAENRRGRAFADKARDFRVAFEVHCLGVRALEDVGRDEVPSKEKP